jgi:gluconate 2-dehydrogenase alpha chain
MARKLPHKDVVVVGLGWTGSILSYELADAGLDVVAIERSPWRDTPTDFPPTYDQDELLYRIRHELFLRPAQTTFSFRNKMDETALPIRSWGAFMPARAGISCSVDAELRVAVERRSRPF